MNRLLLATGVLALCGASLAQSWSPSPKYQSKMGDGQQNFFGMYPSGRFQFADGNFRNSTLVVTKVSLRVDEHVTYNEWTGMGRGWTSVNLQIAPTELTAVSANFSTNHKSSPTQCFSGAMAWPTLRGLQSNPLNRYHIQLPLIAPYINTGSGSEDMLLDFRMSGGTLANNAQWSSAVPRQYYTDGYLVTSYRRGEQRYWHDTKTAGCVDSAGVPPFFRAYTVQYVERFSPSYPSVSFRNRLRLSNWTVNVGPNTPFLNVVDLGIDDLGVPFGSGCERLFLKVSPAALYYPGTAQVNGQGTLNTFGVPNGLIKYDPAFAGLEVFTQSVWNDSRTNAIKLSAAASAKVPDLGFDSNAAAKRTCVYHWSHGPTGVLTQVYWANPILRFN